MCCDNLDKRQTMEKIENNNARDISPKLIELQNKVLEELSSLQRGKLKQLQEKVKDVFVPKNNNYSLLKWLKARQFDVEAAEKMLRASLIWRQQMQVDSILTDFQAPNVLKEFFPIASFGHDRNGQPIFYFNFGHMDSKGLLYSSRKVDCVKYLVQWLEISLAECREQSVKHNRLIESLTVLVDLENFDVKTALYKPVFNLYLEFVAVHEQNFPEALSQAILIKTPKVFSIFYAVLKPLLAEETKKKVVMCGKDNWQEELFKKIHPDEVPKYLEGNLVDEVDGNPFCTSKLNRGGPVPKSYYLKISKENNPDFQTVTIPRKDSFIICLEVAKVNSTIKWTFQSEQNDLAFGIDYQKANKKTDVNHVVPLKRIDCQLVPEDDSYVCREPGTYTIIFDNGFSWLTSKTVLYHVQLLPPI